MSTLGPRARMRSATPHALAQLRTRSQALLNAYLRHRPLIQKILTAFFVLYSLGASYANMTGKGPKGGTREKVSRRSKGESIAVSW